MLGTDERKKIALDILESGLKAAMPEDALKKIVKSNQIKIGKTTINLEKYDNLYLVSFGKAANSMAKVVNSIISIKSGFIVVPDGVKNILQSKKFQIFYAGHPLPNKTSVTASKTILGFLTKRKKNDFVIFLVSGGGSSLLAMPDGISIQDKSFTTDILIRSGATIQEINCIRKHLSQVKGGKLIQNIACDAVALIMSDVMNDDLSSIASGCTYYDDTTFIDALSIIKKYNLEKKIPQEVLSRLEQGSLGNIPETPKRSILKNHIFLRNVDCLEAMEKKSKGWF